MDIVKTKLEKTCYLMLLFASLIFIGIKLKIVIIPLVLSFIFYCLANPIIEKANNRVPISKSVISSLLLTFLIGVISLFLSQISLSIEDLYNEYFSYSKNLDSAINNMFKLIDPYISIKNLKSTLISETSTTLTSFIGTITTSTKNFFSITLIALISSIFIFQDPITNSFKKKHPKSIKSLESSIRKYIIVKTIISLLTTMLIVIYLKLLNFEYILLAGALTFILNFIPSIGSVFSTILLIPIFALNSDSIIEVINLLIFPVIIQFLIGNIIEPKFMGDSLKLGPLVIITSLLFWSVLFGIYGLFLGVPLTIFLNQLRLSSLKNSKLASLNGEK